MKKQDLTIPNLLSVMRLVMIPFIAVCYLTEEYVAAAVLLVISGLTDMFDGRIARRFHQISDLGKILDPMADKFTMAVVVFALTFRHAQIRLLLAILLAKELIMVIGAFILIGKGTRPSESKIFGKLATAALYIVLFAVMVGDIVAKCTSGQYYIHPTVMWVMSILCCVLMLLALVQYYPIFVGIKNGKYNIKAEKFEGEK